MTVFYNDTMKKQIVLQCPCHFTLAGLEVLLSNTPSYEQLDIMTSIGDVETCEDYLNCLRVVDIVILTLRCEEYNPVSLISLIQRLSKVHPEIRILLIMDKMNALMNYFSGLQSVRAILDIADSMDKLQASLDAILAKKNIDMFDNNVSLLLSKRELMVLNKFLSGKPLATIASDLQLSYKTVSHHKRAALRKLGFRSLHPLFK
jgi:DNA-binding NarL/FixJ family response regulator